MKRGRPRQRSLFGDDPAAHAVGPAAPAPEDAGGFAALAARLPASLRLGTSSWSFPGWHGIVYDRAASGAVLAREGLAAYARHPLLRAVGVDRGFYAPVPEVDFAAYRAAVPEDFRFVVKAPGDCTFPRRRRKDGAWADNPRFLDPLFALDHAIGPARAGLGDRLGAILFQFPPLPRLSAADAAEIVARLATFLDALAHVAPCAVEVRSPALLLPSYAAALAGTGAVPGLVVHPSMPGVDVQAEVLAPALRPATAPATAPGTAPGTVETRPLIVRWMLGHGQAYEAARDRYAPFDRLVDEDPVARRAIAGLCRTALDAGRPALVIANNKAEGSAPLTIFALAREIARMP